MVVDALGNITSFSYYPTGRVYTQSGNGAYPITTYTYDCLRRVLQTMLTTWGASNISRHDNLGI